MAESLVDLADEAVEALIHRRRERRDLAGRRSNVAGLLQHRRQREERRRLRRRNRLAVEALARKVAGMEAGHERRAARCAYCVAGVRVCEAHTFRRELVEVRSRNSAVW